MKSEVVPSKDVVYPSVEWALLQGDRCRNYGPEHTRVENENVIVILADEVERLRPMVESWESYEAAQERKGSAVETQPVASNLVRKLRDAAWRYHPESVLAATLNDAAAEIEKLAGTRPALTRLVKSLTHSGIAYEVPDIEKSQEIIHAYHDARELLEQTSPVETTDARIENLTRALHSKQAKIDALMFEFCPGDMSAEQKAEWAKHQKPGSPVEPSGFDPRKGCALCGGDHAELQCPRASDEKCANCGAPWSRHLTNKLICPDAAIHDVYKFRQATPEKASAGGYTCRKCGVWYAGPNGFHDCSPENGGAEHG